ncbi:MAG: serine hydrolase [Chloroflexota bacterium]|nr:serine hydrolase [Chloroflexota bacterium]MDE2947777.1 serine hydrolase [Chloroflexota bacterium]
MIEQTTPEDVGLCAERLGRIAAHFKRYVDDGRLPGYLVLVARRGKAAYLHHYGARDVEAGLPVEEDSIFRIYSMTKPIVSVGLLLLYERGLLQLDDPASEYLPALAQLDVFESGDADRYQTVPAEREMTIRDLLTHTAGLTYGHLHAHPVDAMYRQRNFFADPAMTRADFIGQLAELPLLFSPGTRWNYSVATDVLGCIIEVVSGQSLARFLTDEIFAPLGMADSGFSVSPAQVGRFAANYERDSAGFRLIDKPSESTYLRQPALCSGGGGLVSTASDYLRFSQMLLNEGELDGARILGRKTVELMTGNHLPGNCDLSGMGYLLASETRPEGIGMGLGARYNLRRGGRRARTVHDGVGFGLGGYVLLDAAAAQILGSPGEFGWGGAASTTFWIDAREELTAIFLTQLMPSSSYPIRRELRVLVNQAVVD